MRTLKIAALAAAALVALPAAAQAVDYPPPAKPVAQPKPKGPFKTLTVCAKKKKGCQFTKIQKAVDSAKPGWTIKVADGTYKEGVIIKKPSQRYIKLVGNPKNPRKVRLIGTTLRGEQAQNGVQINAVSGVTVDGFYAKDFVGNGFFVVNVSSGGYMFNHLVAEHDGTYGVYAFNTVGGTMQNSEAYYNNDSGFYIGETPPQAKPQRSYVKNVVSWGNVLGFSGTNMKYVTITKSAWFNNGLGIVPNALKSEKYAPPEDNVISDNDVFFNNFNYYAGAPFSLRGSATGTPYPIGTGILLFGGQRIRVTGNRIYGQNLIGVGALQQILLANDTDPQITPEWYTLRGNQITGNTFNDGGKHPNGRDLFYDGNGTDNCVSGNIGVNLTVPANGDTFQPCPFTGNNTFNGAAQGEAIQWALALDTKNPVSVEQFWKASSKTQPAVKIAGRTVSAMENYTK